MDPITFGALISAAASIGGAYLGSNANKQAADKAAAAQLQAAQVQAAQEERALQFAQQQYAEAAPGRDYLRSTIAESGDLTPLQRQQLAEAERQSQNQIRTSALAGSGRSSAALLRNVESDFRNKSLEANRARSLTAAQSLGGYGQTAAGAIPGIYSRTGAALGSGIAGAGNAYAAAGLANAKLYSGAFGDIGAAIANSARESKFRNYTNPGAGSPTPIAPERGYVEAMDY